MCQNLHKHAGIWKRQNIKDEIGDRARKVRAGNVGGKEDGSARREEAAAFDANLVSRQATNQQASNIQTELVKHTSLV